MNQKPFTLPELLSPCGSPQALRAAVFAGADAVYLGGTAFNARINAQNFDEAQLQKAVDFCHGRGVRIYVTVNTLVTDRKLSEALHFVEFLYGAGVDALITADYGLSRLIRRYFPDFELHASTQFSSHNALSAEYLARQGFSRMVCARELSKNDLAKLCESSPIEIEMFVHGALCASHSGQCLMSAMIGGRSGNRGECAQPCRLGYNGGYPLSLKDLCLAGHIKEILSLGVASLKIEGRMKSPGYVYQVTGAYRRLLDERRNATPAEIKSLSAIFSRSGFTDGYFTSDHRAMLGIRSDGDKQMTRRESVNFIDRGRTKPPVSLTRSAAACPDSLPFPDKVPPKKIRSARFLFPDRIPKTDAFDIVYLPLDRFDPRKANGVILPSVITDSEIPKVREALERIRARGAQHALVGNLGHIALAQNAGFILHGDYRLNMMNSFSTPEIDAFEDYQLSCELNLAQIRDVRLPKSVIVYGKIPVMLLERNPGPDPLKDRKGARFALFPEGKRSVVYNSVCLYMGDKQRELNAAGVSNTHFIFTDESAGEVLSVIRAYEQGAPAPQGIRRIR